MGELPNHLPACAVLDDQCILARDFRAARNVVHLHQQGFGAVGRRHQGNHAIDDPIFGLYLVSTQSQFVRVRHAGCQRTRQHVADFRILIEQRKQRLTDSPRTADAEQVFRRRIDFDNQEIAIEENDCCRKSVDYARREAWVEISALPAGFYWPIAFCCT
jgi:hypothetical protein